MPDCLVSRSRISHTITPTGSINLYNMRSRKCTSFIFFILPSRRHNLPESPPDSEPPYSPADGVGQSPRKTDDFI